MDVHQAARIMSCAHGGQVVLSPSTVSLLAPGAAELRELGPHRLKDLPAPIPLYQLAIDGLPGDFPPLKSLYWSQLPTPTTPFLGRLSELADASHLLESSRLLTIVGPGGTGKTRFAIELARLARDRYPGGSFFVPLAPLRDPSLVLAAIAKELGLRDPGSEIDGALVDRLSGAATLLVVDNVEHLIDSATMLAELVRAAPSVALLVTSRETLRVHGEQIYELGALTAAEAIELFVERAGRAGRELAVSVVVEELCARLDRLPLAIELAAARTRLFTPEQLLDRLGERLDLLRGGRDADPRQQTLRAAVAWSYDLLELEEARGYRALGIFAGGCTLELAEQVCGADATALESLLDKSLLRRRDAPGGPRFWMLETIREFAVDELVESGEAERVRARHADCMLALVRTLATELGGPGEPQALDRLEDEHPDVRVALGALIDAGHAVDAVGACIALTEFWSTRDHLAEGGVWFDRALALDGIPPPLLADALVERGALASYVDDYERARDFTERACELLREQGRVDVLPRALAGLGSVENLLGRPDRAEPILEEARRVSVEAGDRRGERLALHLHGEAVRDQGRLEEAAALLEASVAISVELGDLGFEAATTHSLGDLELDRADLAAAEVRYRRSLELSRELGFHSHVALCVAGLACVAAGNGELELAGRLWSGVEQFERDRGLPLHPHERARYERRLQLSGIDMSGEGFSLEEAAALVER
jgi:predicted ATPase